MPDAPGMLGRGGRWLGALFLVVGLLVLPHLLSFSQQELLVLRQYAIKHRPRVVLLAFFAGNDIFNAEAFDKYERGGGSISLSKTGWSIQKIVARYETFYLSSLARLVFNSVKTKASSKMANCS